MSTWSNTWYERRKKINKYSNEKIIVNGIKFDSAKEARRYNQLLLLEKAGEIENLNRQVRYTLIPTQRDENNKVLERECAYCADFVYTDKKTGKVVVEDTKGFRTRDYIIKRKLMLYVHGIEIQEI